MHERTFLRVPGLGLAAAMAAPVTNDRQHDALLRDALAREEAAYREPCPPVKRREALQRPVRAGAA